MSALYNLIRDKRHDLTRSQVMETRVLTRRWGQWKRWEVTVSVSCPLPLAAIELGSSSCLQPPKPDEPARLKLSVCSSRPCFPAGTFHFLCCSSSFWYTWPEQVHQRLFWVNSPWGSRCNPLVWLRDTRLGRVWLLRARGLSMFVGYIPAINSLIFICVQKWQLPRSLSNSPGTNPILVPENPVLPLPASWSKFLFRFSFYSSIW